MLAQAGAEPPDAEGLGAFSSKAPGQTTYSGAGSSAVSPTPTKPVRGSGSGNTRFASPANRAASGAAPLKWHLPLRLPDWTVSSKSARPNRARSGSASGRRNLALSVALSKVLIWVTMTMLSRGMSLPCAVSHPNSFHLAETSLRFER